MALRKEKDMDFVQFMASGAGRVARIMAGIALIVVGLLVMEGTAGYSVAAIGLAPLAAGLFDFCLLAPLLGRSFSGPAIRQGR